MKIKFGLIIAGIAFFGLSHLTHAQCPQICDDDFHNTALGAGALPFDTGSENTAIGLPGTQYQCVRILECGDWLRGFN